MTGETPALPAELAGDEALFRALRNRAEQDDKRLAFLLRNSERETGLSVSYNCTPDDCEDVLAEKSYGVLSLVAKQVKGLDLLVIPDAPTHANIRNLPYQDDDPEGAWAIAGQLSRMAITIREGLRRKCT